VLRAAYYRTRYRNLVLGRGTRVQGKLTVSGQGTVTIGPNCEVARAVIHLLAPQAVVTIGSGCYLNGPEIVACERVTIGDRCEIANANILETDFHSVERNPRGTIRTAPITIGDDVWIAGSTAILRGATVGDRAVVGYGSVVTGHVPPDHLVRPGGTRLTSLRVNASPPSPKIGDGQ
jgi:acetyltransferase-like isoleucine patch superfamily enzyme